jgi:hypothetical protein
MAAVPIHQAHPLGPLYVVARRFDSEAGYEWERYIAWSGLHHLKEVVSLDGMLCERSPEDVADEDWPHIVNEDFMLGYFTDLDYLLRRAQVAEGRTNLLCVYRNPVEPPSPPQDRFNFQLLGYDVVDVTMPLSATLNCGGFPEAFQPADLNNYGLVPALHRARTIQEALREKYPTESHAETHVWAVSRAAL